MEQLNKACLRGYVGSTRVTPVGDRLHLSMTLATNYIFRSKDSMPVIETTWHKIEAWDSETLPRDTINGVRKGDKVYVEGRIRNFAYTTEDGVQHTDNSVIASTLEVLSDDIALEAQ